MKFLLITYVFVNTVLLANGEPKILGGTRAQYGQFPYQVSLQDKANVHFCGGSLIDARHVVTAAQCVLEKNASSVLVWAGDTDLNNTRGVKRSVQTITIHENYDLVQDYDSDIAMLKLSEAFDTSRYNIKPISLPGSSPEKNAKCNVTGWGKKNFNDETGVQDLRYAEIFVINHEVCKWIFRKDGIVITDNMICAGAVDRDFCQGDTGGPLTIDNTLIGIVSFGVDCGKIGYPGVYTDVNRLTDWIKYYSVGQYNSIHNIQICAMVITVSIYSLFFK